MGESIISFLSEFNISGKSVSSIGFNDVVDILIITYLIYRVMIWIKETRAWSLLKGFLVILGINVSAYFFKLYTVSWLIENTFNVGLIALIVIFQPELRKALEQLGNGKFMGSFYVNNQISGDISARSKEEIIRAVMAMSKVRTGALIVIEHEIAMGEYEQTGIRLNAVISSQLLINIFENKTPLHDGAVIIRHNKITAATCILPLTQANIDKRLGTRHRAALGASEVSDALVVVVSEETGDITVAQEGKLYRKLSEERLRSFLTVVDALDKKKRVLWKGRRADD